MYHGLKGHESLLDALELYAGRLQGRRWFRCELLLAAHLVEPQHLVATLTLKPVFPVALGLIDGFTSQVAQPGFDIAARNDESDVLTFVAESHTGIGAHIAESLNPIVHRFVVRI